MVRLAAPQVSRSWGTNGTASCTAARRLKSIGTGVGVTRAVPALPPLQMPSLQRAARPRPRPRVLGGGRLQNLFRFLFVSCEDGPRRTGGSSSIASFRRRLRRAVAPTRVFYKGVLKGQG